MRQPGAGVLFDGRDSASKSEPCGILHEVTETDEYIE